jgi:hypothetical protein
VYDVDATCTVRKDRSMVGKLLVGAIALLAVVVAFSALGAAASPAYVRPLDARHSPFVGGNRSPRLPSGQQGRLSVVAKGEYDGESLPIIVRNNTSRTVNGIYVTAK